MKEAAVLHEERGKRYHAAIAHAIPPEVERAQRATALCKRGQQGERCRRSQLVIGEIERRQRAAAPRCHNRAAQILNPYICETVGL